ncbi:hypothetical protein [Alloalcanivorax mobilis]|uniref:hypothetical protein n=1 Tax=Alloalcanivorax mobilis TaxID=2019569 RepID=UPI000C7616EA|nr:hypothetical protein [Alloalcanivorax mobilis]
MGDVVPFQRPAKKRPKQGLCQHGYHKWTVVKDTEFDSKQGKLVTRYQCQRCGKQKVEAR